MSRYSLTAVCLIVCAIAFCVWFSWTWRFDLRPLASAQTPAPIAQQAVNRTASIADLERSVAATTATSVLTSQVSQTSATGLNKGAAANDLQRLSALLARKQYDEAIELYSVLYNEMSEAESTQYRERIFSFAHKLVEQSNHAELVALLGQYLSLFYRDLEAISMLAHSQHALTLYPEEITTLFAALDEAYLVEDITRFKAKLDAAITAQTVALSNDPNAVLEFYQALSGRRPEYEVLQLGLSRALLRAGQKDRAIAILNALPAESEHKDEISELLASARQNRFSDTSAVPMQRLGESFSVRAVINGISTVTLLIDTGATVTAIHPNVLQLAGINLQHSKRTVELNTANGSVTVPILRLQSLAIGNQLVEGIDVASIAVSGMGGVDGLLGMNFLNHFKFALDQRRQVILLAR